MYPMIFLYEYLCYACNHIDPYQGKSTQELEYVNTFRSSYFLFSLQDPFKQVR